MNVTSASISRPDSLSTLVYDAIRGSIIDRSLAPGSRVSEAKLAETLQVSKTPVREALLRLEHSGLIVSDGRRGGRVVEYSPERLKAAYELREALEGQTARLASQNFSETDVAAMQESSLACLEAAKQNDMEGFREHDRRFHLAVAAAAQSLYLARSVVDAYDLVWTLRLRDSPLSGDVVYVAEQHTDVLSAIRHGDGEGARLHMSEHIRAVQGFVLGAMGT